MPNPNHEPTLRFSSLLPDALNHTTAFLARLCGVAWAGLGEGSLIARKPYYPDDGGQLVMLEAPAARWAGYDTYGKNPNRVTYGKLAAFILSSVASHSVNTRTPYGLASHMNFEAVSYGSPYCGLSDLLTAAYVRKITYGEAFEQMDLPQYQDALTAHNIADRAVHQVTPKGNGLVFLLPDDGVPARAGQTQRAALDLQPQPLVLPGNA